MCRLKVRFSQSSQRRGVFNYALKVEVTDATSIPSKIFVYHQSPAGADGNTFAEFDHIATPVDFQEIPEDAASETVPWYRTDKCVAWFRCVSDLVLAKQLFVDDINALTRTYNVLTSENGFRRQTSVEFSENGVYSTDIPEEDAIQKEIDEMKKDISGKISKDAMSGVGLETNTAEGIRKAVQSIGNILGANIVKSIAIGFIVSACAMGQAFGAGFSGERFGDIDLDENPVVVTNVTFDGLATVSDIETNYYTKAETDDVIDAIAAYYITSDVQGSAFTNYLALTNAAAYYSGGVIRSPTRNDYAVVLADETHGGAEYRYIYAVPDGSTTGQWEAQYPIEINDYGQLSNKPQINGNTLTGNKTAAQLGIASTADATLTERGFSEWTISPAISNPVSAECLAAFQAMYPDVTSGVLSISVGGAICIGGQAATVTQDISADGTTLSFNGHGWANLDTYLGISVGDKVATRAALQGYQLGSQTDKPLASEAEAEALRTGKQDKLTFDDIPTENSSNPVTSGGVYDETRINPVYDGNGQRFSDWICVPPSYIGSPITIEQTHSPEEGMAVYTPCTNGVAIGRAGTASEDVLSLRWRQGAASLIDLTATRTENKFIGYVLGSQTNKVLASETEAEALRTNKLDKSAVVAPSTSATTGQAADAKATGDALAPLLFAQYYPDGSVTNEADFTAGIKYSFDTTNRTASVKPFCNTGTAADDNSSLVGKVVIPPFVDAQGNPYITDDGTMFKVVGVRGTLNPNYGSTSLTAFVAPTTVTTIGASAFHQSTSLTSISLPAAESISGSAFSSCTSLTTVSLPAATTINASAFAACTSLTTVSLPAAHTVGKFAFHSCASLSSVDFGDTPRSSVPSLRRGAFDDIPTSCKIIVPDAQYDAWTAETIPDPEQEGETISNPWYALVTAGYKFLRHSEWEYAHKYELAGKVSTTALTGEAMPANPTQNELAEAVKKIFTALGGTVTP